MSISLYYGELPASGLARRSLRDQSLELLERLRQTDTTEPAIIFASCRAAPEQPLVDLILFTSYVVIVGLILPGHQPVDLIDQRWIVRHEGRELVDAQGHTPLEQIRQRRLEVDQQLKRLPLTLPVNREETPLGRMVAALIFTPTAHRESQIALDVPDHRDLIKLVGFDELAPLAHMVRIGQRLSPEQLVSCAEGLGGTCWGQDQTLQQDPAVAPLQLRVVAGPATHEQYFPLLYGETVIGRRRTPREREYRLTLGGDELMSSDHAILTYHDDGHIVLRDTSTNGSYIVNMDGRDERIRHTERHVTPGTMLRLGATRIVLEEPES